MHQGIYDHLIAIARKGGDPDTYAGVGALAGLDMSNDDDRDALSAILDEISRHEHNSQRPLLSALVVHGQRGRPSGGPGEGFFKMARQVGRYSGRGYLAEVTFHAQEVQRVFDYWQSHVEE